MYIFLFFFRFMHQQANRVIRAVFEYWRIVMPKWGKNEKLISLCFDEMNIDNQADIDRTLDMVVGPAKDANILMVGTRNFEVPC